jgi:hypothetical protein
MAAGSAGVTVGLYGDARPSALRYVLTSAPSIEPCRAMEPNQIGPAITALKERSVALRRYL